MRFCRHKSSTYWVMVSHFNVINCHRAVSGSHETYKGKMWLLYLYRDFLFINYFGMTFLPSGSILLCCWLQRKRMKAHRVICNKLSINVVWGDDLNAPPPPLTMCLLVLSRYRLSGHGACTELTQSNMAEGMRLNFQHLVHSLFCSHARWHWGANQLVSRRFTKPAHIARSKTRRAATFVPVTFWFVSERALSLARADVASLNFFRATS